jgi:hypothetical protein
MSTRPKREYQNIDNMTGNLRNMRSLRKLAMNQVTKDHKKAMESGLLSTLVMGKANTKS